MTCGRCGTQVASGVRFCPECGNALVAAPATSERRAATLLAVELREGPGGPDAYAEAIAPFSDRLLEVAARFGASPDQVGEGRALLRFGVPDVREDDPERALAAAAWLADAEVAGHRTAVGVATGVVVATSADRPGGAAHQVRGEPVDRAHALADQAGSAEVLADPATAARCRDAYAFEAADDGVVRLRGTTRGLVDRLGTDLGLLVGRDAEVLKLEGVALAALAGRPQLVAVSGAEGLGKTRLAAELVRLVRGRASVERPSVLVARASSYEQELRNGVVADLVRGWVGLPPAADPARSLAAVDAWLGERAPGDAAVRSAIAHLLRLPTASPDPMADDELHGLLVGVVLAAAVRTPLVLVLEDLQWADPASWGWLTALVASAAPPARLLVVALDRTHRPWPQGGVEATTLALAPLAADATTQLLASWLGIPARPSSWTGALREFIEGLVARSGGCPRFLAELLAAAREAGILARRDEVWEVAAGDAGQALPTTTEGLAAARLDRLPVPAKRLLAAAGAIGAHFDLALLAEAAGRPVTDADLAMAVDAGLVAPDRERAGTYRFVHESTASVAYHGLVLKDRQAVHRRIAAGLRKLEPENGDRNAGALAEHHLQAGDLSAFVEASVLAVEHAKGLGLPGEAVTHLRRAVEALERHAELVPPTPLDELLLDLADLEAAVGRHGPALAIAERLLAMRPADAHLPLLERIGQWREKHADLPGARQALETARDLAVRLGDREDEARVLGLLAVLEFRSGEFSAAVARCDAQLAGRAADEVTPATAYLHYVRAISLHRLGEEEAAVTSYREALARHEQLGDDLGVAKVLNALATLHSEAARPSRAASLLEQALARFERLGNDYQRSICLVNLGEVRRLLGDHFLAEQAFQDALQIKRRLGDPEGVALATFNLGNLALAAGRPREALERFTAASELLEARGIRSYRADVQLAIGEALLAVGNLELGAARAREALEVAVAGGLRAQQAGAKRALARYHAQRDEFELAEPLAVEAAEAYAALGDRCQEAETWLDLADLKRTWGDDPAAEDLYGRARDLLAQVEAPPLVQRAEAGLRAIARPV